MEATKPTNDGPITLSARSSIDPVEGPVSKERREKVRTGGVLWLDVVVFLCLLVLGAASLPIPFGGDQGLNLLIGQVIADGGAPYRDVWDLKHPGIFFFFAAGVAKPSSGPELMLTPSPVNAWSGSIALPSVGNVGRTT